LRFAPEQGLSYFEGHGWKVDACLSMLRAAADAGRLPAAWAAGAPTATNSRRRIDGLIGTLSPA
jgi:hypothetical protein